MPAEEIVWRAAARDGAPGVLTDLLGRPVHLFDVRLAGPTQADAGRVVGWIADAAIRVAAGPRAGKWPPGKCLDWVRQAGARCGRAADVQATGCVVAARRGPLPAAQAADPEPCLGYRPITTQRHGSVAVITASAYNGAWSTRFCHSVAIAVDAAARRPEIDQIVLRGGGAAHLGTESI
jgi:putative two-component system hydrogenase maturation factor HypX/HoxX